MMTDYMFYLEYATDKNQLCCSPGQDERSSQVEEFCGHMEVCALLSHCMLRQDYM